MTLAGIGSNARQSFEIHVTLHSDDNGSLGPQLYELQPPFTNFSGRRPFGLYPLRGGPVSFSVSPFDTVTLQANTKYWIKLAWKGGIGQIWGTKDDDEDPFSRPGWSINDTCQHHSGQGAVNYSPCAFSEVIKMAINGRISDPRPLLWDTGCAGCG